MLPSSLASGRGLSKKGREMRPILPGSCWGSKGESRVFGLSEFEFEFEIVGVEGVESLAAAFLDLDFLAGGPPAGGVVTGAGEGEEGEVGAGERGERGERGVKVVEKGKLKLSATGFSLTTRWRPGGIRPPAYSFKLSPAITTIFVIES